jgi:hypothetical protein
MIFARRATYLLVIPAVLGLACSGTSRPSPLTGDVSGVVVAELTFVPVGDALVNLAGQGTRTDSAGGFAVTGLAPGTCTLTVAADGYLRFSKSVVVAAGANDLGQLWLKPAGDAGAGDGGVPTDARPLDAPVGDAAPADGGLPDAAQQDATQHDAGQHDAVQHDAGQADGPCQSAYRRCATGCCAWTFDDLEAVGAGEYAALRLDSSGRPHIAYGDDAGSRVRYAWRNGTTWSYETVASLKGLYVSLTLDSSDRPRVVFVDASTNALHFASRASGSWTGTTVDNAASFCSVNVDATGQVHVGYRESQNQHLKHAFSTNESTFMVENVDTGGSPGWYAAMDVSPAGVIHLVYFTDQSELRHAYADSSGGTWTRQVIDAVAYSVGASSASISLDAAGVPHVAYRDYASPSQLKYATRAGTGWQITVLQDHYGLGSVSIATSPAGAPQVVAWDHLNADLAWGPVTDPLQVIDDNKKPGLYGRALGVDSGGNPHLVYTSHTTPRYVGYAH